MFTKHQTPDVKSAFTLVEVLVVIAVIAIVGSLAVVGYSEIREGTREQKLESDVQTLNRAVQLHRSAGGELENIESLSAVLEELKKATTSDTTPEAGGSLIDRRIEPIFQTSEQAAENGLRAFWNPEILQFEVLREGEGGVHDFRLNEALAVRTYADSGRGGRLAYSQDGNWIWDYEDHASDLEGPDAGAPDLGNVPRLGPPIFNPAEGSYPLANFEPMEVTISAPSSAVPSRILYSLNNGPLTEVTGPIPVMPSDRLRAVNVPVQENTALNSVVSTATYSTIPVALSVAMSGVRDLTYTEAGGAVVGQEATPPAPVVVSLANAGEIPANFLSSDLFEILVTTNGSDPAEEGNPSVLKSGVFSGQAGTVQVDVSVPTWGSASSRQLRAVAVSKAPGIFLSSAEVNAQMNVISRVLSPPVIVQETQTITSDIEVEIELPENTPVGARLLFTVNGADPGSGKTPTAGILYTQPIQTGPSTIRTRVFPPEGALQWFDTSALSLASYSIPSLPAGALVASANIYGSGTFVGNLTYAAPPVGQPMNTLAFYSETVIRGNLYLPGLPELYIDWKGPSQRWTLANDALFTNRILGRHFGEDGVEIVPAQETPFPRVKQFTPPGPPTPVYDVFFYGNSRIEGKVYRQYSLGTLPTVPPPLPRSNNNTVSYSNWDFNPANPNPAPMVVNPAQFANVNLNTPLAQIPLLPGAYGAIAASSDSVVILGNPNDHSVVAEYHFQSLSLTGGADLRVVGPVKVTVGSTVAIHNGAVMGNSTRPDWLQMNFFSTNTPSQWNVPRQFHATGTSQFYGTIVAPNGEVALDGSAIFQGAVTSYRLQITSNSVLFLLPPVITP